MVIEKDVLVWESEKELMVSVADSVKDFGKEQIPGEARLMPAAGDDRYWVELPVVEARASYGCYMDLAELTELILGLPQVLDRDQILGLEYRPW